MSSVAPAINRNGPSAPRGGLSPIALRQASYDTPAAAPAARGNHGSAETRSSPATPKAAVGSTASPVHPRQWESATPEAPIAREDATSVVSATSSRKVRLASGNAGP